MTPGYLARHNCLIANTRTRRGELTTDGWDRSQSRWSWNGLLWLHRDPDGLGLTRPLDGCIRGLLTGSRGISRPPAPEEALGP